MAVGCPTRFGRRIGGDALGICSLCLDLDNCAFGEVSGVFVSSGVGIPS